MKKTLLSLFIFHFSLFTCLSQAPITVQLTRKMQPSIEAPSMRHIMTDTMHLVLPSGHDTTFREIDQFDMIGGDFVDGKVKFAIVVNLKLKKNPLYAMYLAPYKSDTVMIHPYININYDAPTEQKIMVIKANGIEYTATLNDDGTEVTMQRLDGTYQNPDLQIWDSLMPDGKFTLLNGKTSSFAEYKHQHKYIYVVFWSTWQPGSIKNMDEIDQLKLMSVLYHDALTILSFHRDTITVRQIEKQKSLDWIEAKEDQNESSFPPGFGSPNGILFDENGKAVATNVRPEELKPAIEKLLHVTN